MSDENDRDIAASVQKGPQVRKPWPGTPRLTTLDVNGETQSGTFTFYSEGSSFAS